MKLENRFTVPVPVDQAWQVLLDVERVAPCMPGATLTKVEGDRFEGTVKVKVGPINLTYGGKASFVSKDEASHVAVIDGSGKETRGTGTAKALITCRLLPQGESTQVEVETELNVTGKPAQFGRGVLADVSGKLVDRFAACLSEEIGAGAPIFTELAGDESAAPGPGPGDLSRGEPDAGPSPAPAEPEGAPAPAGPEEAPLAAAAGGPDRRPAEPIDLLGTAGAPVLKRAAPVLAVLAVLVVLLRRLRH